MYACCGFSVVTVEEEVLRTSTVHLDGSVEEEKSGGTTHTLGDEVQGSRTGE